MTFDPAAFPVISTDLLAKLKGPNYDSTRIARRRKHSQPSTPGFNCPQQIPVHDITLSALKPWPTSVSVGSEPESIHGLGSMGMAWVVFRGSHPGVYRNL